MSKFIGTAFVLALTALSPLKAHARDLRSHVTIGRSYPTYAPLVSQFSPVIQHSRVENQTPNACDDLGIEGIESLSGSDAGTCYPSIAGRR